MNVDRSFDRRSSVGKKLNVELPRARRDAQELEIVVATIDRQVAKKQIKVWVFNSQNSTPDVQRVTDAARKQGIPVATITETLTPASGTFEDWQSRQLEALAAALARTTGR